MKKAETRKQSFLEKNNSVIFYVISLPYPGPGKLFPQSTFCSEALS